MSDANWQALYSAALAESDPRQLNNKIEVARRHSPQAGGHPRQRLS